MTRFETLSAWLSYIEKIHPANIEMGLERVRTVAARLDLLEPKCPVITVAGTNGKGSTVAGLEAIYLRAGYRVGAFTTPFILRHNEEVRIMGVDASDEMFCDAFEKVEAARGDVQLTYFEFNTLAALLIFAQSKLDVCLLEVGLGGRLDAVNIVDADLAIVTSIGIDHIDWLGNTRELIGREKAGIFRPQQIAVCGDEEPPVTLLDHAEALGTLLSCQGKDFQFVDNKDGWTWRSESLVLENLPKPNLALQNMSTVLMAVQQLQPKLPIKESAIREGFARVMLPGRIQVVPGDVTVILDVSHNAHAANLLSKRLAEMPSIGKTRAVFSMLADKDIHETLSIIKKHVDNWYIASLPIKRGASLERLEEAFQRADISAVGTYETIETAFQAAMKDSVIHDRVLVFGSFHTVERVVSEAK